MALTLTQGSPGTALPGPHPKPGPMSTQTQGALWLLGLVRSYARCIALSDSWALCAGCGSRKGQTPVTTQGEIFPMELGEYKERGVRGIYTPGDSIKRGAKIAACCQVVGDYNEWG